MTVDLPAKAAALAEISRLLARQPARESEASLFASRATDVARAITDDVFRINAVAQVAESLAKGGYPDHARTLLDEVIEVARSLTDEAERSMSLVRVAEALVEVGQSNDASTLLNEALEIACLITDDFKSLTRALPRFR